MFDANIQYYSYDNVEGDDFGVGYLGNKEFWIRLMNGWNRDDGLHDRFNVSQWEELESEDLRGCVLAEVAPDDNEFLVTWSAGEHQNTAKITQDNKIEWVVNTTKNPSIPRWINRLKNQLREQDS